jgi:hypothetical protein
MHERCEWRGARPASVKGLAGALARLAAELPRPGPRHGRRHVVERISEQLRFSRT